MIVQSNGRVLWDSDAILQNLCCTEGSPLQYLYPKELQDDIVRLERDLGHRLGASARCLAYNALLRPPYYAAATQVLTNHSPRIERWIYKALLYTGMVPQTMSELLKTTDPTVLAQSRQELRLVFSEMSERLERASNNDNDNVYLMDTPDQRYGLTAADITFCSLAYFIVRPPELAPLHLAEKDIPPEILELSRELSTTRAGQHALQVYQKHRPVDPQTGSIKIQCVNQNRIPWPGMVFMVLGAGILQWVLLGWP